MNDQPAEPPQDEQISANVTVSGSRASLLRDLAAVLGRTPEALIGEWATGSLTIPSEPIGDDPRVPEWGLFDGAADLAARTDEHLREGFGQRPMLRLSPLSTRAYWSPPTTGRTTPIRRGSRH
ncbi:hypothetical protein ABCR94_10960 [Streptomyces sp. 21So2-11]|uniref:hypothetical protein n=1 Tax=Streptomyces sp. 21So2-11 TaxID=3144408 RepID=UPI00321912A5